MMEDINFLKKVRGKGVAVVAVCEDEGEDIFMVYEEDGYKDIWLFDSGCFYYVCGQEWFFFYKEFDGKNVILFSGKEVKIEGDGDVNVKV